MCIVIQHPSSVKQQIVQLLQTREEGHSQHVYNSGLRYLRHYCGNDHKAIDFLTRSKLFWNWWKRQWGLRDEVFITSLKAEEMESIEMRQLIYCTINNAKALASELTIPSAIFKTFCPIINAVL